MEDMKLTMFKSKKMSVSDFRKLLDGRVNKSIHAFLEQCDEDVELKLGLPVGKFTVILR